MDSETQTALRAYLNQIIRIAPAGAGVKSLAREALALLPPEPAAGQAQEPSEVWRVTVIDTSIEPVTTFSATMAGEHAQLRAEAFAERFVLPYLRVSVVALPEPPAPQPVPAQDGPEQSVEKAERIKLAQRCAEQAYENIKALYPRCVPNLLMPGIFFALSDGPAPALPPHQDVEALEAAQSALGAAWDDLHEWVRTTRHSREHVPAEFRHYLGHERGMAATEAIRSQIQDAIKLVRAALARRAPADQGQPKFYASCDCYCHLRQSDCNCTCRQRARETGGGRPGSPSTAAGASGPPRIDGDGRRL